MSKYTDTANTVWFLFGGLVIAIEYVVGSLLMLVSVIGIPFARETLRVGSLNSSPFGKRVYGQKPFGRPSFLVNLFWLLFAGVWIALSHVILGLAFALTIIGFRFAQKHFRLAKVALVPFGVKIRAY